MAGSKRLSNLIEILSPTIQSPAPAQEVGGGAGGGGGRAGDDGDNSGGGGGARPRQGATGGSTRGRGNQDDNFSCDRENQHWNGSYHCSYHKKSGGKCDVCSHMTDTRSVWSKHFQRTHAIRGHNSHLGATVKPKTRWFVYLQDDTYCDLQYVGSTSSLTHRWANTKKRCNDRNSNKTGLETHFMDGCPGHADEDLSHIKVTLLDLFDVTHEQLKDKCHKTERHRR